MKKGRDEEADVRIMIPHVLTRTPPLSAFKGAPARRGHAMGPGFRGGAMMEKVANSIGVMNNEVLIN
jgi:hypothetical protein